MKLSLKKKLSVFIITMLVLYFVMEFRISFMGMSLCIIFMYISFELSIKYFMDFFIKKTNLFYIVLSLLNFLILFSICASLSIEQIV